MNQNKVSPKDKFNWYILFIVSLSSIVAGIYRDGFAALFPFLQIDFHLNRAQLGLHFTLFYSTCGLVSIYAGRLVDLKGTRWGLIAGCTSMGIFYILHSLVPNFITLLSLAAFTGLAVSLNLPTVSKSIVEWFPRNQITTALGLESIAFPMGGLIGAILLPFLGSILGWRKTIILPGLIAILCTLFILYSYQGKREANNHFKQNKQGDISFWNMFFQLIKNSNIIKISIFGFFLGAMGSVITAHFTLFLVLDCGFSKTTAGIGFAIVQFGSIMGRGLWGLICDRVLKSDKKKTFLYMGLSFTSIIIILILLLRSITPQINLIFLFAFLIGWSGYGWPGLYNASIAEIVKEKNVGIAIGFASLFMRVGMMVAPPIFGYLADLRGSYEVSWLFIGIIILIASLSQYISFSFKKS